MNRDSPWANTFQPGKARWLTLGGSWTPEELHQLAEIRGPGRVIEASVKAPDREGVRIVVRNPYGEILMQQRAEDAPTNPGMWTTPGGRLEPGETPEQGAGRKLAEEAGLYPAIFTPLGVLYFTSPDDGAWVRHHVYTADTTLGEDDLILGEGQELRFVDWSELSQLDISASARNALAIAWLAADPYGHHDTSVVDHGGNATGPS